MRTTSAASRTLEGCLLIISLQVVVEKASGIIQPALLVMLYQHPAAMPSPPSFRHIHTSPICYSFVIVDNTLDDIVPLGNNRSINSCVCCLDPNNATTMKIIALAIALYSNMGICYYLIKYYVFGCCSL